ncbi:hypothetical protein, partial [Asaia sp. SF2.1]
MSIRIHAAKTFSALAFSGAVFGLVSLASASTGHELRNGVTATSSLAYAGPRPPAGQKWDPCEMQGACVAESSDSLAYAGPRPPAG